MHQHIHSLTVPTSIEETWLFFSNAANLKLLTPPEMELTTDVNDGQGLAEGMVLHFEVKPIQGFTLSWQSTITEVKKPFRFVDKQTRGPFAYWRHEHIFEPLTGGTRITDRLSYKMPFGAIGQLAYPIFVKNKIKELFEYRKERVAHLFGLAEPK